MSASATPPGARGPRGPADPPLIAWYGDDFTGASASLEVLAFAGLSAALCLRRPDDEARAALGELDAVGLAGTARAESPAWMRRELPGAFDWLASSGAPLVHYKLCSTLDSSPTIGSIGCAAEIGLARLGGDALPCLVAAPWMGRHQCFGQLFARAPDGAVHRLDRHPVMARHPVTPMDEADVARHLARQTALATRTLSLDALPDATARFDALVAGADGPPIVCLDAARDEDLAPLGALLWERRTRSPFVLGSQGVQRALVEHWRASGRLARSAAPPRLGEAPTLALSGSMSETTARQIEHAGRGGYRARRLDVGALVREGRPAPGTLGEAVRFARDALAQGRSPLFYTALGPDDPAAREAAATARAAGLDDEALQRRLGRALGALLRTLLLETGVRRALIAGGDSSGRALEALDAIALRARLPISPGLSVFTLVADGALDGLEIALKGGQMGEPDGFESVRRGSA